jgi:hypothetical protein
MRPDLVVEMWDGERKVLGDGLTLVRCGGHFEGGTALRWSGGADGGGALLSGDIVQVIPDRRHVGFMYSDPNLIPLPAAAEGGDPRRGRPVRVGGHLRRVVGRRRPRGRQGPRSSAARYARALTSG